MLNLERVIELIDHIIQHNTADAILDYWQNYYRAFLLYLPHYNPELNFIVIVGKKLKYQWRRFVTWSKVSFGQEPDSLLSAYDSILLIRLS